MFKLNNNCPKDNFFPENDTFLHDFEEKFAFWTRAQNQIFLIANNFSSYISFVPGSTAKLFGSLPGTDRTLYGISLKELKDHVRFQ